MLQDEDCGEFLWKKKFDGVAQEVPAASEDDCLQQCINAGTCEAVNFNKDSGSCDLLTNVSGVDKDKAFKSYLLCPGEANSGMYLSPLAFSSFRSLESCSITQV